MRLRAGSLDIRIQMHAMDWILQGAFPSNVIWLLNIQLGSALGRMHILSAITECFDALNRTESWLVQPLVF